MLIQNLIESYGAKNYLRCLRERLRKGKYSWAEFALKAAAAYCIDGKPRRVEALLCTLDTEALTLHERDSFEELRNELRRAPAPTSPDCALNMIVRNESANIGAALDSADTLFDEVVICDTGSTDDTVEQARMYGAVIVHDTWENDFSRARNRALAATSSAWVFWMDADDRLDESSAQALGPLWRSGEKRAMAVCVVNHIDNCPAVEFLQVRLFPRLENVRFERRIHEQIMFSLKASGVPFSRCDHIRVIHAGYRDRREYVEKLRRNQAMIAEEVERAPSDPSLLLALADGCAQLGDTDKAALAYRKLCESDGAYELNPDAFVQAHVNRAILELARGNTHEAKRYFYRSLYLDAKRIESFYYLGRIYLKANDEKTAAGFFVRAAGPMPEIRMTAVNNTMVRLESLYYLSELLLKWGHNAEMEDLLRAALVQFPMVPRFYTQIGRSLFARQRLKEAAEMFIQSISLCPQKNDEAYIGIAQVYHRLGDAESAMRLLGRALRNGGKVEKIQKQIELIQRSPAHTRTV